jgi:tetratricopeptide (TPR) repeat protein
MNWLSLLFYTFLSLLILGGILRLNDAPGQFFFIALGLSGIEMFLVFVAAREIIQKKKISLVFIFYIFLLLTSVVLFIKYLNWFFFDYLSIFTAIVFYLLFCIYIVDRAAKLRIYNDTVNSKALITAVVYLIFLIPTLFKTHNVLNMLVDPFVSNKSCNAKNINHDIPIIYKFPMTSTWVKQSDEFCDKNDYIAGIYCFSRAIKLEPENTSLRYHFSQLLSFTNNLENAVMQLDTVLMQDSNFFDAYSNRGLFKYKLHKNQDAIVDFDRAIKINPANPIPYINKSLALKSLGRMNEVCEYLQLASQKNNLYKYDGMDAEIERLEMENNCK